MCHIKPGELPVELVARQTHQTIAFLVAETVWVLEKVCEAIIFAFRRCRLAEPEGDNPRLFIGLSALELGTDFRGELFAQIC